MPKRLFIRDGGLTSSIPTPPGYTVIGANDGVPKKQIESTISDIGGDGGILKRVEIEIDVATQKNTLLDLVPGVPGKVIIPIKAIIINIPGNVTYDNSITVSADYKRNLN